MNRALLLCLLLLPFFTRAWGQVTGNLQGNITDEQNNPLIGVNIGLEGTTLGDATDANGYYEIQHIPEGDYVVAVTGIGFNTRRKKVTIVSGEETTLGFSLNQSTTQLQDVEIIGRKETTYQNDVSFVASKTATPLFDIPQSISYVTKEVMADQQAFRMGDVVKNISGVNMFSGYDDYTLRGFRVGDNQLINGLRVAGGFWTQPLINNLERIEVIKGPASALYGNTDPGGTINRVTKKPLNVSRKAISFATGSFNTLRATADFTGPMNEEQTLLYRVNVGYQNTDGFRNLQGKRDILLAPSISFLPSKKTRLNFDMVYSYTQGKLDRGQPIFDASAGTDLTSTPIEFAIGKTNDYMNEENLYITSSLNHRFSDNLSLNVSYLKYLYTEDLQEHRTSNSFAVDGAGNQIPSLMGMQVIRRMRKSTNDNITTYLVYDAQTGPVQHTLLLGYDYAQKLVPVGGSSLRARGYRNASNTGVITNYDPAKPENYLLDANGNPVPNVPHFNLTDPSYVVADISDYFTSSSAVPPSRYYSHGIYLQDQMEIGRWQMLLGLRQDFYVDYLNYQQNDEEKVQQQALLPRVGIVYSIKDRANLYATYVKGYQPQGPGFVGSPDIYGGPFDPLESQMLEAGLKTQWFDDRLLATISMYQIEQNNILVNANNPANPEELQQRGQERSRGIELDIVGNILTNLSLTANYAYNRAVITESDNEAEIGRLKENAPLHQGGIWAKYTLEGGFLPGIGFGLGSNFVTERNTFDTYALDDKGEALGLQLPGYAIFDAAIFYTIDKFKIAANFNNIFNKTHWIGGYSYVRLYPGAPSNFLVNVAYTF